MTELEFYQGVATQAQKSAIKLLIDLNWPERITSNHFRGMPGTTGIGKWIQKAGYSRLPCSENPDGAWRDDRGRPYSLYQKNGRKPKTNG